MYYGYIFPGLSGVCTNFADIENYIRLFPFPKYRVFYSEAEAWAYVKRHQMSDEFLKTLNNYGSTFTNFYVKAQYFIWDNAIYINLYTDKLGKIKFHIDEINTEVAELAGLTMIKMSNVKLNNDLISSHTIAIYYLFKFIGEFVDVNLEVPDRSIYYMLTAYKGKSDIINRLQNVIKNRLGELSLTVKEW